MSVLMLGIFGICCFTLGVAVTGAVVGVVSHVRDMRRMDRIVAKRKLVPLNIKTSESRRRRICRRGCSGKSQ
jgi:hypothetical protein